MAMATTIILDRPGRLRDELDALEQRRRDSPAVAIAIDYLQLLRACIRDGDVRQGRRIHSWIAGDGIQLSQHSAIGKQLVQMYLKCGSLDDAKRAFDELGSGDRDSATWNAILAATVAAQERRRGGAVALLYALMRCEGVEPTKLTYISLLRAFGSTSELQLGRAVHAEAFRGGGTVAAMDPFLATALLTMYSRCGSLAEALMVFDAMASRDVVAWNAMISCCSLHGDASGALALGSRMLLDGEQAPNASTLVGLLANCRCLVEGLRVHGLAVESGLHKDVVLATAVVSMYGRIGLINRAVETFRGMKQRNVVSWNALLAAFANAGESEQAWMYFRDMQLEGYRPNSGTLVAMFKACTWRPSWLEAAKFIHQEVIPALGLQSNVEVATSLITMYASCCAIDQARQVFDSMVGRNLVSWNAMLAAYAQNGHHRETMELFHRMTSTQEQQPNKVTFVTLLSCCSNSSMLDEGRWLHDLVVSNGSLKQQQFPDLHNAIISMYGKCGSINEALAIFQSMHEGTRDRISWNAIISSLRTCGRALDALTFFHRMQMEGFGADELTIVSVLAACTELGATELGGRLYDLASQGGVRPDAAVAAAAAAMYGRCGMVAECEAAVATTVGTVATWNAVVGAYARHGNGHDALKAMVRMQQEAVKPDVGTFAAVLAACRYAGLAEEACRILGSMRLEYGVEPWEEHYAAVAELLQRRGWVMPECLEVEVTRKRRVQLGQCSRVVVKDKVHEFVVRDVSHSRSAEIYFELARLRSAVQQLRMQLYDIDHENMLWTHSARLAIAFGLLASPKKSTIKIVKNVRVCSDCHTVIKLISTLTHRQIVVVDAGRFHQFTGGICSCGDCW